MKVKSTMIFCMIMLILSMSLYGCEGEENSVKDSDAKHSYVWWMPQGEDSSYYSDYKDNPAVQYMLTRTYKGEDGKDITIDLEIQIPAAGTAQNILTTSLSTGDYADVIDVSSYTGSIADLYNDGIVMDITNYVEEYMPNYKAFLDAHPDLKMTATNVVNGEKKYLQLYSYYKEVYDQWCGFEYRRDWIVKYGTNPTDGSAFQGEYKLKNEDGTVNKNSWEDNVVFPSGGPDPIYISDWEWMLEIFKKAIAEEGITDGYCMSLYYPGYMETGELVSAFGGGGSLWYKNKENKVVYGAETDNFRTYLQCMNQWYSNGWIDTAFPEHATDMFYKIDDAKVRQGKIGLWIGLSSELMGVLDRDDGYTKGMVVYAARQPINDVYGTDAQKNKEPYAVYQRGMESSPIVITDKASKKDLVALFSFLDYAYTDEAMLLRSTGLNKQQYEATQNELYQRNKLYDGAYTDIVNADGIHEIEWVDTIKYGQGLENAAKGNRFFGLYGYPDGYLFVNKDEMPQYRNGMKEWSIYTNTGNFEPSFKSQLSAEDSAAFSKIHTNIREFMSKNVPNFIVGEKDPNNDKDWQSFIKAMSKYGPEKNTQIYQELLDQLN